MFNYTKETIINNMNNVIKGTDELIVKRGGNYKFANIIDKTVFKTVGVEGTAGSAELTVGTLSANKIYRFTMFVETPNQALADYAYPNWGRFGKIVLVEFKASGTANTDASKLAEVLKLSLQPDNEMFTVSVSSAVVTVTMKETYMKISEITFEEYDETNDVWIDKDDLLGESITENVEDFATAKWLVENLRFPSYPNIRYNHLYSDESPVDGTVYTQYAFQYLVKHSVPGGLSSVGQVVDSITTHVFYVPSTKAIEFEGKFEGITFDTTVGNVSSLDSSGTNAINKSLHDISTDDSITDTDTLKTALGEKF